MPARTFAIGDIHGCDVAFETLLDALQIVADDRVVVLGDVVDRGPDSRRCIDMLLELQPRCDLIFLIGNHEEMLLDSLRSPTTFRSWMMVGGRETFESYDEDLGNIPEEHRQFLAGGKDYFVTETEIYIHANLEPGIKLELQAADWLRWRHLTGMEYPHESGRRVICGHTQQKSGRPLAGDGWVCLDTGAYRGNPLTCLHVETDLCYQTTQDGKVLPVRPLEQVAIAR